MIVRTIVSTQYLHQQPDLATTNALNAQLCLWESELPNELRIESVTPDTLFLTSLLHMTYQYARLLYFNPIANKDRNLFILLHRRTFLNPSPTENGNTALDAATKSTRILEDLLSHHLVQHAPPHLYPPQLILFKYLFAEKRLT